MTGVEGRGKRVYLQGYRDVALEHDREPWAFCLVPPEEEIPLAEFSSVERLLYDCGQFDGLMLIVQEREVAMARTVAEMNDLVADLAQDGGGDGPLRREDER